jgi:putative endonuclease
MTNNIWNRVLSHKRKETKGFASKYSITRLVYFEETRYINQAIAREKETKGWQRSMKLELIRLINPKYLDLSKGWYTEIDSI